MTEHNKADRTTNLEVEVQPRVEKSALTRYLECDGPSLINDPVENLRFYLSFALKGQDWLDVEPFINALQHRADVMKNHISKIEAQVKVLREAAAGALEEIQTAMFEAHNNAQWSEQDQKQWIGLLSTKTRCGSHWLNTRGTKMIDEDNAEKWAVSLHWGVYDIQKREAKTPRQWPSLRLLWQARSN